MPAAIALCGVLAPGLSVLVLGRQTSAATGGGTTGAR